MNYFKDLLENNESRHNQSIHANVKLNHPVLYVFFEENTEAVKIIQSFYEQKIKNTSGVVYLHLNSGKPATDNIYYAQSGQMTEVLYQLQNSFLRESYAKPVTRRVYFILHSARHSDEDIKNCIVSVKDFFISMKNTPILDVYALTDDSKIHDSEHAMKTGKTYKLLERLVKENICNMVYLLSNLNSAMVLMEDASVQHYHAIAACSVLKDCWAAQNYGLDVYDEQTFIQNSHVRRQNGCFYSLGTKTIDKPMDALRAAVLKTLLTERETVETTAPSEKRFEFLNAALTQDWDELMERIVPENKSRLYSLAIDIGQQNDITLKTYGELTRQLFGKNILDLYYSMNEEAALSVHFQKAGAEIIEHVERAIKECLQHIGFYKTYRTLHKIQKEQLTKLHGLLQSQYEESLQFLDAWKSTMLHSADKKRRGFFGGIYEFPFVLAQEYIQIRSVCFKNTQAIQVCQKCEIVLKNYITNFEAIIHSFAEAVSYFDSFIAGCLFEKPLMIQKNFENYYRDRTEHFIQENYNDFFQNLYSCFYSLGTKDINALFEKIYAYSDKILETPAFTENIFNEIYSRILAAGDMQYNSEKKITDLLFREMIAEKQYFINIITNEEPYAATCFITGDKKLIDQFSNRDTHLNLFFDDMDKQATLVYMTGAFTPEELFYDELYKGLGKTAGAPPPPPPQGDSSP